MKRFLFSYLLLLVAPMVGTAQLYLSMSSFSGAAIEVEHATLTGNGMANAPLGLADEAVTTDKLRDESVTSEKLIDRTVTGDKIADEAIVAGQNVTITRQGNGSLAIKAAGGGSEGLTSVASDASLAGNGTSGDPLAVSVPLVLMGSDADGIVKVTHRSGPVVQLAHPNGAVFGYRPGGSTGSLGGVYGAYSGHTSSGNFGYLGGNTNAVYGNASSRYAGYFQGNVHVTGTLSKGGGSFKIDHPLDPANKYLSHSFVESPDMVNVYNGNITTDAEGYATVT